MGRERRQEDTVHAPSYYITARLGFNRLLTGRSTWEEVRARLREYPITQALEILARISAMLFDVDEFDATMQRELCVALFAHKAGRVLAGLDDHVAEVAHSGSRQPSAVLFDQAQIVTAAKVALLEADYGSLTPNVSTVRLAEALLMLNDLAQFGATTGLQGDLDSTGTLEEWAHFLVTNSLFYKRDNRTHELARTWELYLEQPSDGGDQVPKTDVAHLIRGATGLSPIEYWAVGFGIFSHWLRLAGLNGATVPAWIDRDTFFATHFLITPEEATHYLSLFAREALDIRAMIRAQFAEYVELAFHPMPLAQWPLVGVERAAFCPSLPLLWAKLTDGLHHLILNAHPAGAERDVYLVYAGARFERYVQDLLARAYSRAATSRHGRLIHGDDLIHWQQATGVQGKLCDALILYPDAVIVIEIKGARFRLDRRVGLDRDGCLSKLREIFVDAASQIDETVGYIRDGTFRPMGVDPRRVRKFYPLIVFLEDVVVRTPVYRLLDRYIDEQGLLKATGIQPWQALSVGELEWAEGGISRNYPLREFLDRKLRSAFYRTESATNFHIATGDRFFAGRSPHLEMVFDGLASRAREFFAAKAKPS